MKNDFVSKALKEVWEWKEALYQEVKGLPVPEAIDYLLKKAKEARPKLDIEDKTLVESR